MVFPLFWLKTGVVVKRSTQRFIRPGMTNRCEWLFDKYGASLLAAEWEHYHSLVVERESHLEVFSIISRSHVHTIETALFIVQVNMSAVYVLYQYEDVTRYVIDFP